MKPVAFRDLVRKAKQRDSFWAQRAALEFTVDVARLMTQGRVTKADLARRLGTSPAYVTKILRGDANFTIDSMVRLVRAVGGRLHIHVADEEHRVRWLDIIEQKKTEEPIQHFSEFDGEAQVNINGIVSDANFPLAA